MDNLVKSNVNDLVFQNRGVLVNTNNDAYKNYKTQKSILEQKDEELDLLKLKISHLEDVLNSIISKFKENE